MNTQTFPKAPGNLGAYAKNRLVVPTMFNAIGSFACLSNRRRYELLSEVYGPLMGRTPVVFRSLDSAEASQAHRPAVCDKEAATAQGAFPIIYQPSTIGELIEAAEAMPAARRLGAKLRQIPSHAHGVASRDGCMQQPAFGAAMYLANFPSAVDSLKDSLMRTRDTGLINECRAAGFQVRSGREIHVNRTVNLGASTGSGAEIWDALLTKVIARDLGYSVRNYLYAIMPSANVAADAEAGRQLGGRFLLELCRCQESPEKIVLPTFDGRVFQWRDGPIYDGIFLVAVGNEFMAASSRDELAYRLALLAVAQVCTPYVAQSEAAFSDSVPAQGLRRHGLPIINRVGITRAFSDPAANCTLGAAAAAQFVSQSV